MPHIFTSRQSMKSNYQCELIFVIPKGLTFGVLNAAMLDAKSHACMHRSIRSIKLDMENFSHSQNFSDEFKVIELPNENDT